MINVVTFDYWNTLAIPNKKYAQERTDFFRTNYGLEKSYYTEIKNKLDAWVEEDPTAMKSNVLYHQFNCPIPSESIKALTGVSDYYTLANIELFLNSMFINNDPTLYSKDLNEALAILRENNILTGIISNTNFISGEILDGTLDYLSPHVFDVKVFSDLVGISKPNPLIFNLTANEFAKKLGVSPREIMIHHIGDNPITDVQGPESAGHKGYLIKDYADILDTVKEILHNEREQSILSK